MCGLVWAGLAAAPRWGHVPSAALEIPLAPGHALHLNVWPRVPDLSFDIDHGVPRPRSGPLTVAIWHQRTKAVRMTQLATFTPPTWPLPGLAIGHLLAAIGLRRRSVVRSP